MNRDYEFGKVIYLEFDKKKKLGIDPLEVFTLIERIKKRSITFTP